MAVVIGGGLGRYWKPEVWQDRTVEVWEGGREGDLGPEDKKAFKLGQGSSFKRKTWRH